MKEIKTKFLTRLVCRRSVTELAECDRTQLVWFPRHTGSNGNDTAYRLARKSSLCAPTGHEPSFGLSSRVAGEVIGVGTGRKHEVHWQSTRGRRQARAFVEDFC